MKRAEALEGPPGIVLSLLVRRKIDDSCQHAVLPLSSFLLLKEVRTEENSDSVLGALTAQAH